MILVAASVFKLHVKDWTLRSRWTLVLHKTKIYLQTAVIVLLDNLDRDKQLSAAYSLEPLGAINLSQVFFNLYHQAINLNRNILSPILTHNMCSFVT